MKKELKNFKVTAELYRLSDYENDKIVETRIYYRRGVSEKQVISRLKFTEKLFNYDNSTGSIAYNWRFKIEDIEDKRSQLSFKDFGFDF